MEANGRSFRLFILTSFAGRFGKASLPKRTLRKSVPAQEDASEKRPCLRGRFGMRLSVMEMRMAVVLRVSVARGR
jgi:hypothetical protein